MSSFGGDSFNFPSCPQCPFPYLYLQALFSPSNLSYSLSLIFTIYPFLTNSQSHSNSHPPHFLSKQVSWKCNLFSSPISHSLHFLFCIQSSICYNVASVPQFFEYPPHQSQQYLVITRSGGHVNVCVTFNSWSHLGPFNATMWLFLAFSPISSIVLSLLLSLACIHLCQSLNSVVFNTGSTV